MHCVLIKLHESCEVLPYDVKLKVHHGAFNDVVEVGEFVGVGDDGDLEAVALAVAYSKAGAVDGDAALLHGDIAFACHRWVNVVVEGVIPAAVGLAHTGTGGGLVHMTLHDVSVKAAVHEHTALHVHLIAYFEQPEVAAVERLLNGGDSVGAVAWEFHHCEAHTVVRYALIYFQLIHKAALERDVEITFFFLECHHAGSLFYYA